MNKNNILKALGKKFSGLELHGQYLISENYAHVLRGFCLEWVPGGVYIWNFWFPLADDFGTFNLLYSSRIKEKNGYLPLTDLSNNEVTENIYNELEPLSYGIKNVASLDDFISLFQKSNGLKENPYALMILARAEILNKSFDQALMHLNQCIGSLDSRNEKACRDLIDLLRVSPIKAIEYVCNIESFVMKNLNLTRKY